MMYEYIELRALLLSVNKFISDQGVKDVKAVMCIRPCGGCTVNFWKVEQADFQYTLCLDIETALGIRT